MAEVIPGAGTDRTDIDTPFRQISFSSHLAETMASPTPVIRIMPTINVVKLGGQSIMDRGRAALFPLLSSTLSFWYRKDVCVRLCRSLELTCSIATSLHACV